VELYGVVTKYPYIHPIGTGNTTQLFTPKTALEEYKRI
jgi:hypothetical protein